MAHSVSTPEPIRWIRWGDFMTTNRWVTAGEDLPKFEFHSGIPRQYKEKSMGIEERVDRAESKLRVISAEIKNELVNVLCPRGLYSENEWGYGSKYINPSVNEVLVALLDLLELEPILTPDEKVELRGKKDAE